MLARLLRQVECPIHGVRIIRLPGHRFRAELVRRSKAGSRRRRENRCPGNDAGGHIGDRGLDSRISGSVAVAASPLAMSVDLMVRSASARVSNHESLGAAILRDGACAPPQDEETYRPVLTRVHSRFDDALGGRIRAR